MKCLGESGPDQLGLSGDGGYFNFFWNSLLQKIWPLAWYPLFLQIMASRTSPVDPIGDQAVIERLFIVLVWVDIDLWLESSREHSEVLYPTTYAMGARRSFGRFRHCQPLQRDVSWCLRMDLLELEIWRRLWNGKILWDHLWCALWRDFKLSAHPTISRILGTFPFKFQQNKGSGGVCVSC